MFLCLNSMQRQLVLRLSLYIDAAPPNPVGESVSEHDQRGETNEEGGQRIPGCKQVKFILAQAYRNAVIHALVQRTWSNQS